MNNLQQDRDRLRRAGDNDNLADEPREIDRCAYLQYTENNRTIVVIEGFTQIMHDLSRKERYARQLLRTPVSNRSTQRDQELHRQVLAIPQLKRLFNEQHTAVMHAAAARGDASFFDTRECANCNSSHGELMWCGGCKLISYCSPACQGRHWRRDHRPQCLGIIPVGHNLIRDQDQINLIADAIGGFDKFELAHEDDITTLLNVIAEGLGIE